MRENLIQKRIALSALETLITVPLHSMSAVNKLALKCIVTL